MPKIILMEEYQKNIEEYASDHFKAINVSASQMPTKMPGTHHCNGK